MQNTQFLTTCPWWCVLPQQGNKGDWIHAWACCVQMPVEGLHACWQPCPAGRLPCMQERRHMRKARRQVHLPHAVAVEGGDDVLPLGAARVAADARSAPAPAAAQRADHVQRFVKLETTTQRSPPSPPRMLPSSTSSTAILPVCRSGTRVQSLSSCSPCSITWRPRDTRYLWGCSQDYAKVGKRLKARPGRRQGLKGGSKAACMRCRGRQESAEHSYNKTGHARAPECSA